jgi:hypothetical protein
LAREAESLFFGECLCFSVNAKRQTVGFFPNQKISVISHRCLRALS